MPIRSKTFLIATTILVVLFYITALTNAGTWLVKNDTPPHADAVVMLMGSIADRVLQVSDLCKKGIASKVIIVKENMGGYRMLESRGVTLISSTEQVCNALISLGIPKDSIIVLPGDARSTQTEATIINEYLLKNNKIDTLLIVTSSPHTRRAAMIFKAALKGSGINVSVFCSPSAYTDFDVKSWWKGKENIQTVLLEYVKMADFLIFEKRKLRSK